MWIRSKAHNNAWSNDSLFIQFSGTVTSSGSATWRIGSTSATEYNLEDCGGCGLQNWGWQDNGWGVNVLGPEILFGTTGPQTIRIQPREDGISIDQIVLSPSTFLNSTPGALKNDATILPKVSGGETTEPPPPPPTQSTGDVVLYAGRASVYSGWRPVSDASGAGGIAIAHPDAGASKLSAPLASPTNYFEMTFNAEAGTPYRLWIRSKAERNSWANDSLFIQFSGSVDESNQPIWRIGTTSSTAYNLEDCSGCGLDGWGWQDNGWGVNVLGPEIRFATSGPQTIRIQTREDGLTIDQIVLSPTTYLSHPPGLLKRDTIILQEAGGS